MKEMDPKKGTKSSPRIREALGRLYQEEGPYFQEYLRRFREDPTSRIFAPLSEAYRRMGRIDDAIAICQEGMQHHPDFHGGRVALARCFLDKREFVLAKHELEKVVNVVPENILAQKLLGEACVALKEHNKALRAFRMAHLLSPNDAQLAQKIYELEKARAQQVREEALDKSAPPKLSTSEMLERLALEEGDEGEEEIDYEQRHEQRQEFLATPPRELTTPPPAPITGEEDFFEESPGLGALPEAPAPVVRPQPPVAPARPAVEEEMTSAVFSPLTPAEMSVKAQAAADVWPPLAPLDPVAADEAMGTWDNEGDTEEGESQIEALLGVDAKTESESFQITHISHVFEEPEAIHEITTATLGDLYFAQEKYDKALQIFEKIAALKPGPEIEKKVQACRVKLGVDNEALVRMRQIAALKGIMNKVKDS